MPSFQRHVFVCINERPADHPKGCCKAKGGVEVRDKLKAELAARGISKVIRANNAGCLDQCEYGVSVVVYPEQVWYGNVTVDDIPELIDKHLVGGEVVERLLQPDQPHLGDNRTFPKLEATSKPKSGLVPARGPETERAGLGPARGPETERAGLVPARGPETERAGLGPARGDDK